MPALDTGVLWFTCFTATWANMPSPDPQSLSNAGKWATPTLGFCVSEMWVVIVPLPITGDERWGFAGLVTDSRNRSEASLASMWLVSSSKVTAEALKSWPLVKELQERVNSFIQKHLSVVSIVLEPVLRTMRCWRQTWFLNSKMLGVYRGFCFTFKWVRLKKEMS